MANGGILAQYAGYLAGLIDGEGHVALPSNGRRVTICNTEKDIIDAGMEACRELGIRATLRERPYLIKGERRIVYEIDILGMSNHEKLLDLVPIRSQRKLERLKQLLIPCPEGRCRGCGCLWSEATDGCRSCWSRHWRRRRDGVSDIHVSLGSAHAA